MALAPGWLGILVQSAANRVIFKRLSLDIELLESIPPGLKPWSFHAVCGTTEVVPIQNINDHLCGGHH
jgi:hypothetical protein